jgi:L-ascorbate metabolism protein UlaG (beta-lactamase superfamily)
VQRSIERVFREFAARRIGRRSLLAGSVAAASSGLAVSSGIARGAALRTSTEQQAPTYAGRQASTYAAQQASTYVAQPAPTGGHGTIDVRWIGGGVLEVSTPDSKQIALVDAWVWNNSGAYQIFGVPKPPEYSSAPAFAEYLADRAPEAILVLLTHDHGDHAGDYIELLSTLVKADLPVQTTGEGDLLRVGMLQKFKDAGLDQTKLLVNNGSAQQMGGTATFGQMQATMVRADHSNGLAYPAVGYMLDIGGVRVYCSGDTDLFGDMQLLGQRYHPQIALMCAGGGPFTVGPADAAMACQMMGVSQAVPIHYGYNPLVIGPMAGDQFRTALASAAPGVTAQVLQPGESRSIQV